MKVLNYRLVGFQLAGSSLPVGISRSPNVILPFGSCRKGSKENRRKEPGGGPGRMPTSGRNQRSGPSRKSLNVFAARARSDPTGKPAGPTRASGVTRESSFLRIRLADPFEIRTRIALPVDIDRVVNFMSKSYFKCDPSLVNIGLANAAEPPSPLVYLMREQIKEGMTIIAEAPDNCVIGAAINGGCCPSDPKKMLEFAQCCCEQGLTRDLIKFQAYMAQQPKLWDRYCVHKIFECSHLCVDTEYLGKGIGKRLVRESWYLARDCGYQLFRIDCTSTYTIKIAEGFGWECVFTMPYSRHYDHNGLVFKHIKEPHTEVRVFVDEPLGCKDYCAFNPTGCKVTSVPKDKPT